MKPKGTLKNNNVIVVVFVKGSKGSISPSTYRALRFRVEDLRFEGFMGLGPKKRVRKPKPLTLNHHNADPCSPKPCTIDADLTTQTHVALNPKLSSRVCNL